METISGSAIMTGKELDKGEVLWDQGKIPPFPHCAFCGNSVVISVELQIIIDKGQTTTKQVPLCQDCSEFHQEIQRILGKLVRERLRIIG